MLQQQPITSMQNGTDHVICVADRIKNFRTHIAGPNGRSSLIVETQKSEKWSKRALTLPEIGEFSILPEDATQQLSEILQIHHAELDKEMKKLIKCIVKSSPERNFATALGYITEEQQLAAKFCYVKTSEIKKALSDISFME